MFPKSCENLSSGWKNLSQTPNLLPIFIQVYPLGAYKLVDIYPTSPRKSDFYQQALKLEGFTYFPPTVQYVIEYSVSDLHKIVMAEF